jgi:uncharacterized membrane protein
MAELLIVGFPDNIHRATGVIDELRVLDDRWILELADTVAVHRDADGVLTMDQSYQPTGSEAADWSATLGLLIGATLPNSFIAGANQPATEGGMASAALTHNGLDDAVHGGVVAHGKDLLGIRQEFVDRANQLVRPGDSAIYAILETSEHALVAARFQRYGGAILHLSLSREQLATIEQFLRDDRPR